MKCLVHYVGREEVVQKLKELKARKSSLPFDVSFELIADGGQVGWLSCVRVF